MTDRTTQSTTIKIPRRISSALLNSLAGGVVPRVGLEYIAVGRKPEIMALLSDLETVESGGAAFRLVAGRYGSGKSFLLQLLRNNALERGFVVADADLSPERRLIGTDGQGVATYRQLMSNLSVKARQEGGALSSILEKWISDIQLLVANQGTDPASPDFAAAVEAQIYEATKKMQYMVNGFDFATAVTAYWRGHQADDDRAKDAALRWLRGEYGTKTESLANVGIRSIINDDNWYDQIKSLAMFFKDVGYKGLIVIVDEAVNLYKITNSVSRQNNYERLLAIYNDTMQGRAQSLAVVFAGTLESVEDPRRGLYSYDALRSRLSGNRFAEQGFYDNSTPVLRLNPLTPEEILVLLRRVGEVHAAQYPDARVLTDAESAAFIQAAVSRVGSDILATPREFVRDFAGLLSVLRQNPEVELRRLLGEIPINAAPVGAMNGGKGSFRRVRTVTATSFHRLAPFLQEFIYRSEWDEIRPIQAAACDVIFNSDDHLLLTSGTASGKTEAALLPALTLLHESPSSSVGILYVSPLKALINDQFERVGAMIQSADIPVWHWHGDVSASHKAKLLNAPSGVLQITPESLESMLINRTPRIRPLFDDLRFVIVDEVHALMESDRGRQLLCQIERIETIVGRQFRRIGLSATLGDVEQGKIWLRGGSDRRVIAPAVPVPKRKIHLAAEHFVIDDEDERSEKVLYSGQIDRLEDFNDFIFDATANKKSIIFSNRRADAENVIADLRDIAAARKLRDVYHVHHGDISAPLRLAAEEALKRDDAPAVVGATSTLELGIDIGGLDRVIQIDATFDVSGFVQRLGRSGRRGQPPELIFAVRDEPPERAVFAIDALPWNLLQVVGVVQTYLEERWIELAPVVTAPYSLLYHQTMSVLVSLGDLTAADLARRVLTLSPFAAISPDDYRELLRHLIAIDHIQRDETGQLLVGLAGERIVRNYRFYAVFADLSDYRVVHQAREIGTVQEAPQLGDRLRLAGRTWVVTHLDDEKRVVVVDPARGRAPARWLGAGGDIDTKVRGRIRRALTEDAAYPYLSERAMARLTEARELARRIGVVDGVVQPVGGGRWMLHGWMGSKAYRTLAAVAHGERAAAFGVTVAESSGARYALVESKHASAGKTRAALSELVRSVDPESDFLPAKEEAVTEKYDPFVPRSLRRKAFVRDRLDLGELRAIVDEWK